MSAPPCRFEQSDKIGITRAKLVGSCGIQHVIASPQLCGYSARTIVFICPMPYTEHVILGKVRVILFSRKSETWRWAWANEHIPPEMRQKAKKLNELCASTGLAIFHQENAFKIDEASTWELAAIAVKHLGAVGCYRAPASDGVLYVFLALTTIRAVN